MKNIDLKVGALIGRWLILKTDVYNPNSKSKTKIKCCLCECQCDKKTQRYVANQRLKNGTSKSCGCLRSEQITEKNLNNSSVRVGNVYGKLTVIKDLGLRQQQSRNKREKWSLCQCSCGSEPIEVKNNMLQNGWKKSCGCLQSQGELVIEKCLQQNNINFIKEYSFTDLKGENNGLLRFDFAIFEDSKLKYLIEFDGKQHYEGPEGNWRNTHSLEQIQKYDNLKNEYCKKNNILLKRIPYYKIKEINIQTILSNIFDINLL